MKEETVTQNLLIKAIYSKYKKDHIIADDKFTNNLITFYLKIAKEVPVFISEQIMKEKQEWFSLLNEAFSLENMSTEMLNLSLFISQFAISYEDFQNAHNKFTPLLNIKKLFNWAFDRDENFKVNEILLTNSIHDDKRGSHHKFFTKKIADSYGFDTVKELFTTYNNKGTLRGLHRQVNPTQQKILKVINGSFNLRVIHPLEIEDELMCAEVEYYDNLTKMNDPIFVPEGSYVGYVSLEDNSIMQYIADGDFDGEADDGINPFHEDLNIDWKYDGELILSDRDKNY